jgi:hypothetical protein
VLLSSIKEIVVLEMRGSEDIGQVVPTPIHIHGSVIQSTKYFEDCKFQQIEIEAGIHSNFWF